MKITVFTGASDGIGAELARQLAAGQGAGVGLVVAARNESRLPAMAMHGLEAPSAWVQRWSHLVQPGATVLDVACGHGRHARWFYERNHALALVDRSQAAIDFIAAAIPSRATQTVETVVADIENGPWPFENRQFGGVIVTNYLWRPLMPTLLASVAPGGLLIYETFAQGNETVGKPSRPDFLLRSGELLALCRSLHVVGYEDGFEDAPDGQSPRFVQRITAMGKDASGNAMQQPPAAPPRYRLSP
ncbi:MAG: methyltransferase type 11 [Polaromonas sp.]|jgi:SAM-dependent methyltransferase|nr:methyltransferase type 11 [Polaromonas sp.]